MAKKKAKPKKLGQITLPIEERDLEVRPKLEGGADWEALRPVLARVIYANGYECEVWWWRGATVWSGVGSKRYKPCELLVATPPSWAMTHKTVGGANTSTHSIVEGGRLSKKMLLEHADKIDAMLAIEGVGKELHPKKTLIIHTKAKYRKDQWLDQA
jgi:hypothetical protein